MDALLKFVEFERAVVERAGQAEAVFDKALLARAVAVVHRAHLRERHVGFIHKEDEILGKIVDERQRRGTDGTAADDAGIVLDARAIAQLAQHLDIVARALADALGLDRLALGEKLRLALVEFTVDLHDGALEFVLRCDIMRGGIDGDVLERARHLTVDGVEFTDPVDLVAEEFDAHGLVAVIRGVEFHRVAAHAEAVALKGDVVALVADLDEALQEEVALHRHARAERDHELFKVLRLAKAINARYGRDDDHIAPLEQRAGGGEAQAVDLFVRGGILCDVGIRMGDIGLGLIVVVVGDKVFHRVFGEKLLELRAKLRGEGLIVREHERGALDLFDDACHRERLARARDAEQDLLVQAHLHALRELFDGLRLVARGLEGRVQLKFHIRFPSFPAEARCAAGRQSRRPRR